MLIQTINLCKTYKNGIAALTDINLSIDYGAVSYTHLDVYKRQQY